MVDGLLPQLLVNGTYSAQVEQCFEFCQAALCRIGAGFFTNWLVTSGTYVRATESGVALLFLQYLRDNPTCTGNSEKDLEERTEFSLSLLSATASLGKKPSNKVRSRPPVF